MLSERFNFTKGFLVWETHTHRSLSFSMLNLSSKEMIDVNKSLQFGWRDHAKFLRRNIEPRAELPDW